MSNIQVCLLRQSGDIKKMLGPEYQIKFPNIGDIFNKNINQTLEVLPPESRVNIFYTLANHGEKWHGSFEYQSVMGFDIDGIDTSLATKYFELFCKFLSIDQDACHAVMTGHGLQILVNLDFDSRITKEGFFHDNREKYTLLADYITAYFAENNLKGHIDTAVFHHTSLFRFPDTVNSKPHKGLPDVRSIKIHTAKKEIPWSLEKALEKVSHTEKIVVPRVDFVIPSDVEDGAEENSGFKVDRDYVLQECGFIKWCGENQESVNEPQWYAMLSILSRIDNELCHEYSKDHKGYNKRVTEKKIEQTIRCSGPRTCANIATLWDSCGDCPHKGKVKSPIVLRHQDYIKTQATGFYFIDEKGKLTPDYLGLMKYFARETRYITSPTGQYIWIYNGDFWETYPKSKLLEYANEKFKPTPSKSTIREEFAKTVMSHNVMSEAEITSFFAPDKTAGKVNLKSCVYDMVLQKKLPKNYELGFQYVLDWDMDESQDCPKFKWFLDDIMGGDRILSKTLAEYFSLAFSGIPNHRFEKALFLIGSGMNGKSTLIYVMQNIWNIGKESETPCTAVPLKNLGKAENAIILMGKLLNIDSDAYHVIKESDTLKKLISGDLILGRKYYHGPITFVNRAKLVFSVNDMPSFTDCSDGMVRKSIMIPFNRKYVDKSDAAMGVVGTQKQFNLREELLAERVGIFNFLIENLKDLLDRKEFLTSKIADDLRREVHTRSSKEAEFLEEYYVATGNEDDFLISKDIYEKYVEFCQENSYKNPVSRVVLGIQFQKYFKTQATSVKKINGESLRVVLGVREKVYVL